MSELKPCHCCGSTKAKTIKATKIDGSFHSWKVYCPTCQVRTGPEHTKKEAITKWNTRHVPEGYVLVPVEPTEDMKTAGFMANEKQQGCCNYEENGSCGFCGHGFDESDGCGAAAVATYKAMMKSAKEPQS